MRKIEISEKSVIFTVLFLLGLWFTWQMRQLIFSLLIAFILMSALTPAISRLKKKGLSHNLATIVVYLLFIAVIALLFSVIVPPIVEESTNLFVSLPTLMNTVNPYFGGFIKDSLVSQYLPDATNQVFKFASGLLTNALFIVSTLFFGFYLLLEQDDIVVFFAKYIPQDTMKRVGLIVTRASERMSSWFWGELTLMFVVGIMNYVGFTIIGLKYALPLAVLAGILEVVPNIGPTLAAVPAFLVGASHSYFLGASSLAVSFIVQQLENNLIVPLIMKKAVGISPIATLIVLVIGAKIGGVLGILLAIPAFLFLEAIVLDILEKRKVAAKAR